MITEQSKKVCSGLKAYAEMQAVPWYVTCSLHWTEGSGREFKKLKNTAIEWQALRRMLFIQTTKKNRVRILTKKKESFMRYLNMSCGIKSFLLKLNNIYDIP